MKLSIYCYKNYLDGSMWLHFWFPFLIVTWFCFSLMTVSVAKADSIRTLPAISATAGNALIPMREKRAYDIWNHLLPSFAAAEILPGKIFQSEGGPPQNRMGRVLYDYDKVTKEGVILSLDASTGDPEVALKSEEQPQKELGRRAGNSLPEARLRQSAINYLKRLFPEPLTLNSIKASADHVIIDEKQPDGSLKRVDPFADRVTIFFNQQAPNGAAMLNQCRMDLRRDTGQLLSYVSVVYRANQISSLPTYTRSDVIAIGRWALSRGEKVPLAIVLYSEFSQAQRKGNELYEAYARQPELRVYEDPWLHQRLAWNLNFNVGRVYMDANTGEYIGWNGEYNGNKTPESVMPSVVRDAQDKLFALAKPTEIPKPKRLLPPTTSIEVASVNFNSISLNGIYNLHYPPIIRDGSPLVFSEYFPKFLIAVAAKDKEVTLEGQLKEKHKAVIKLGERKYTLDGKEAEFATPPVKIDGRIYLPAELLQQLNGVLIRWEPKKKLLWVDTRYLRRP